MALSSRLTARSGLDLNLGRTYLAGLLNDPKKAPSLETLVHGRGIDVALEREIILNWYTGVYKVAGERRLATHAGALVWKALNLPAPGTCSGKTGYWAKPHMSGE